MAHNTDKEDNHFEDELETDTLEDVYVYVTRKQYREGLTQNQKRIVRRKAANFCVVDGELVFRKKHKGKDEVQQVRYIRERKEQLRIVQACHGDQTSGHLGYRKTLARITERFMWKGVTKDAKEIVQRCDICQHVNRKLETIAPALNPVPVKAPWYHLGVDFVGPIAYQSPAGNRYILTVIDYFTKWAEAIANPDKSAFQVANSLFKIFMRMGIPRVITTDQGTEFNNHLDKRMMSLLQIDHRLTTAYHPQANGLVERFNQTLQNMIVKFIDHKKEQWEDFLDTCVYSYNTSKQESTQYSPFELMFARKPVLPVDINTEKKDPDVLLTDFCKAEDPSLLNELHHAKQATLNAAKANILKAQQRQKEQYDKRNYKPGAYAVGAKMLIRDNKRKKRKGGKLDYRWLGPYEIVKSLGKGLYSLKGVENPEKVIERVHGTRLKPYMSPIQPIPPKSPTAVDASTSSGTSYSDSSSKNQKFKDCEVNRLQDQQMESDSTARNSNSPVPLPSLSQGISKEHSDVVQDSQEVNSIIQASTPLCMEEFVPELLPSGTRISPICGTKKGDTQLSATPKSPENRIVDAIFDSPKGVTKCKRLLQFSSPDKNCPDLVKPQRKRKLLKDVFKTNESACKKVKSDPVKEIHKNDCEMDTGSTNNAELTKIWNGKPCHVVKARIGRNAVHHGSFHSLKPNQDVNDEIIHTYLELLSNIQGNTFAMISQTLSCILSHTSAGKHSHLLSKESLSTYKYIGGCYNQGSNHWILIAMDLEQKSFYYLDPYGPSRSSRGAFAAVKNYFKRRGEILGKDHLDITKFELKQLKRKIQYDTSNCGVYCMKMAEQLFLSGSIEENSLCRMNTTQARIDIGVALLSYSVDMTERCIMCGAGEQSISHPQYVDWVRCDKCKQWSHIICTNLKPEEAKNVKTFSCHECSQDIHQINDFE
ncbi:uncharacterized protein [Dysidea avara]|uniref:uncharacterized protein isoform X2 n=1 Tax=Dysidea avara TaxID=196820 RepID=UPI00332B125C